MLIFPRAQVGLAAAPMMQHGSSATDLNRKYGTNEAVLKCLKDDRCADHHTDWDKFLPKRGGCTNNEPTCLNKDGEKVSIKDCCPPICQQCMK
jgi:hypothetical protein